MILRTSFYLVLLSFVLLSQPVIGQDDTRILTYGEYRSAIFATDENSHRWQIDAAAREMVSIEASRIGGQFQPTVRLLDITGNVLAESGESTFTDTALLNFTAGFPAEGLYFIEVSALARNTSQITIPDEYSLKLEFTGQHRESVYEGLAIPAINPLPLLENGDVQDTAFNVPLYGQGTIERGNNTFLLMTGTQIITLSDSRLETGLQSITVDDTGAALQIVNRSVSEAVFFSGQDFTLNYNSAQLIYTFIINNTTITTDFFRMKSLRVNDDGIVIVEFNFTDETGIETVKTAYLTGETIDLQRGSQAVNLIRLDDEQYINTTLTGWDSMAYLDDHLTLFNGGDARINLDRVFIDDLRADDARTTLQLNYPQESQVLSLDIDPVLLRDVDLLDGSATIRTLSGREISETAATLSAILIENQAVQFERANDTQRYRLVLPDGTEVETPLSISNDETLLAGAAGYVPRGFNNFGDTFVTLCPCQSTTLPDNAINPANGNFHYAVNDIHIPSQGLSLDFERYYNSRATETLIPDYLQSSIFSMGAGWRHSYQTTLDITLAPYNQVTMTLPDGAQHIFQSEDNNANRFLSRTLLKWTLERIVGQTGQWVATRSDGLTYHFDRAGHLTRISEAANRSLNLIPLPDDYRTANAGGQFIVDTYGRRLELYTDNAGLIQRVRDPLLRDIVYEYDDNQQLTNVDDGTDTQKAQYIYNDAGLLSSFDDVRSPYARNGQLRYDTQSRVIEYSDGDKSAGRTTAYNYTENRNPSDDTLENIVHQRTSIAQDDTRTETFILNPRFLLTDYQSPLEDFTYQYSYDDNRDALNSIRFPGLLRFFYTLDDKGNLIRYQNPLQNDDSIFDYENFNDVSLLTRIRYPDGAEDRFIYDTATETDSNLQPTLIASQKLLTAARNPQEAILLETRYIHDDMGRIVLIIDPGADETSFIGTQYDYDNYGYVRAIHQGIPLSANATFSDIDLTTSSQTLNLVYDLVGQLRAIRDGEGHLYTLSYDAQGNLIELQSPDEDVSQAFQYDDRGNLIYENDRGQIRRYDYDVLDRITQFSPCDENNPAPCEPIEYAYDDTDNLILLKDESGTHHYTYDALNHLTSVTDSTGLVTRYTTFVENNGENIQRQTTLPSGKVLVARYNILGRLIQYQVSIDSDTPLLNYNLNYTPRGFLRSISVDPPGRELMALSYDLAGRLINIQNGIYNTAYSYTPGGNLETVTSPAGKISRYVYDTVGNLNRVIAPDESQHIYQYDKNGNLILSSNPNGAISSYRYDTLNQLIDSIQPGNAHSQYAYDIRGNLTEAQLPFNTDEDTIQSYTYDTLNRLLSMTDAEEQTYTYTYREDGQLANIVFPNRDELLLSYNVSDSVTSITQNPGQIQSIYNRNIQGQITGVTLPSGNTNTYNYTSLEHINRQIAPFGLITDYVWRRNRLDTATDSVGRSYAFAYEDDAENIQRLASVRDDTPLNKGNPLSDVALRLTSRFQYDADGYLTDVDTAANDEFGQSTRRINHQYIYNAAGYPIEYADPTGAIYTFSYDADGNRIEQTSPDGRTIRYVLDDAGQIREIIYHVDNPQLEATELFDYNAAGNVIRYQNREGIVSTYAYNKNHQMIRSIYRANDNVSGCTGTEHCIDYTYDVAGNLIETQHSDGMVMRYFYAGNQLSRIEVETDGQTQQFRYRYDTVGNLLAITRIDNQNDDDPDNDVSLTLSMNYDALNRRVRYLDEANNSWSYSYDNAGNLEQFNDPSGRTYTYAYDVYNRVEQITYPDDGTVDLRYDAGGYLQSVRLPITSPDPDAEGQQFLYETDEIGRLTAIRYGDSPASDAPIVAYQYDAAGNVFQRSHANGTDIRYLYDETGRITRRTIGEEGLAYVYDDTENTITTNGLLARRYEFDDEGRLLALNDDSKQLRYTYDTDGRLITRASQSYGTVHYAYDGFDRLIELSLTHPDDETRYSVNMAYDGFNRLIELTRSNGVRTVYSYDNTGRPISIQHFSQDDERLDGFAYQYDAVGNLSRVNRITDGQRILYSYDRNQRLIDERWLNADGDVIYTMILRYDAAGNRMEAIQNGQHTLYRYNNRNQFIEEQRDANQFNPDITQNAPTVLVLALFPAFLLLRRRKYRLMIMIAGSSLILVAGLALAQVNDEVSRVLYDYDAVGNLINITYEIPETRITEADKVEEIIVTRSLALTYDAEQRLISVQGMDEDGAALDTTIGYDAITGKLAHWQGLSEDDYQFIYDDDMPLALQNAISGVSEQYLYLNEHERLLTIDETGAVQWHLNDYTGTTRRSIADDGTIIDNHATQMDFRAFGAPVQNVDATKPTTQFAGQWIDPTTGYYLMGRRAYDPDYGRFLQADPIYQDIPDSLYVYARNRPTVYFDPSGTVPEPFLEPLETYLLPQMLQPEN
ncbi:MAG: RHS repeat-associated core domain-containing protein, partial [Aggregatilineales bacterium]